MYETKEILKNQFKKLPKDIQDAILAVDLRSKMQLITKKNNLHIDQAEALENEAVFVLLGLEHPNSLVANIATHVEVSEEKAEAIAEDLNREIFLKVRESLKKIFEEREEGMEEKKPDTEEIPSREDILREIEDKEHHNLPAASKTERHLEIPFPSEIVEKSAISHLEASFPSEKMTGEINLETKRPSEKMTGEIKREKPVEINFQPEPIQRKTIVSQDEALRTMPKDIVKAKMGGMVSVPKEMVEIGNIVSPPKAKLPDVGKIDPYRESLG